MHALNGRSGDLNDAVQQAMRRAGYTTGSAQQRVTTTGAAKYRLPAPAPAQMCSVPVKESRSEATAPIASPEPRPQDQEAVVVASKPRGLVGTLLAFGRWLGREDEHVISNDPVDRQRFAAVVSSVAGPDDDPAYLASRGRRLDGESETVRQNRLWREFSDTRARNDAANRSPSEQWWPYTPADERAPEAGFPTLFNKKYK